MLNRIRPRVEALEDRQCLSTMLQATLQGHTLKITGNDEWNIVQVIQDDANDTLQVVYGQLPHDATYAALVVNTQTFKSSQITKITVDLGAGNDNFEYALAPDTDLVFAKDLLVATGDGDDCVTINTTNPTFASPAAALISLPSIAACNGVLTADNELLVLPQLANTSIASAHEPLVKTSFNITVNTGLGDDCVSMCLGDVNNGVKLGVAVDLGDGNDQAWFCDYGTVSKNATVTVNVNGAAGDDAICVGTYGEVLGTLNLNTKGGTGDDYFLVDLQGLHNGKTTVGIDTGAGLDLVDLNQQPSPFSFGSLLVSPIS